jgi:hypothetical protein
MLGTGAGSDFIIRLNPFIVLDNPLEPNGSPAWNDTISAHELIHGLHFATGTSQLSTLLPGSGWDNAEEKATTLTGTPSEAQYLANSGYPWHRESHAGDSFFPTLMPRGNK